MKKAYSQIAALLLSSMLTAASHSEHNHSDKHPAPAQQAHLHGIAKLTLVLEGDALEISLESPAANIVGFEHQAISEKHIKAVEKARVHIPAHREHPFWFNVNTYSGLL